MNGITGAYKKIKTPLRILAPHERQRPGDIGRAHRIRGGRSTPVGCNALTEIIRQQSIMVRKGLYFDTCDPYLRPSDDNVVLLERSVCLFPLSAGFLGLFASLELAQRIFEGGRESPAANVHKSTEQIVGWLTLFDALNTLLMINDILRGGEIKLSFPTEASIVAFLSDREGMGGSRETALFHTASHFLPDGRNYGERLRAIPVSDRHFSAETASIFKRHVFVYRTAPCDGKISRYAQSPMSQMNTGIVYEVVTL